MFCWYFYVFSVKEIIWPWVKKKSPWTKRRFGSIFPLRNQGFWGNSFLTHRHMFFNYCYLEMFVFFCYCLFMCLFNCCQLFLLFVFLLLFYFRTFSYFHYVLCWFKFIAICLLLLAFGSMSCDMVFLRYVLFVWRKHFTLLFKKSVALYVVQLCVLIVKYSYIYLYIKIFPVMLQQKMLTRKEWAECFCLIQLTTIGHFKFYNTTFQ